MSLQIEMPQLSADGETATLAGWLVEVGDTVEQGDVIAELETDKSTVELEAPGSGTIAELTVAAGTEDIEPGVVLGRIDPASSEGRESLASSGEDSADDGDAVDDGAGDHAGGEAGEARPAEAPPRAAPELDLVPAGADVARETTGDPRRSTPLARRAAEQSGVDLESVSGTGPGGRVVEADVLRLAGSSPADEAAAGESEEESGADVEPSSARGGEVPASARGPVEPAEEDFEIVRLSAMRRTIARRMTESKQQVPHFYLRMRIVMDELIAVRARLNAGLAEEGRDVKISVNDFIVRAAALALREVPDANVQFAGDAMHRFERVDVSVAVATDGGLVTPVVRDADRKGLVALAEEVKALALQAREGSLRPEQYQGGNLTVSNLGMYGIETVYPILNPPQACILGVGAAEEQPVVRDGEIAVGRIAGLTLAADHRAVDGAVGAQLLAALRARLEDPMGMML